MRGWIALFVLASACHDAAPSASDAAPAPATASASASVTASATATPTALATASASPSPTDYVERVPTTGCDTEQQQERLTKALHGIDGTLSLLGCPEQSLAGTPVWNSSADPNKRAILRVMNDTGRALDRLLLGSSSARLERDVLRSDGRPTFLVTEDLTAGMGTYSGPATTLYDVVDAHLAPVLTKDGKPISGGRTMHATWRLEPRGKGKDFLTANISPNFAPDGGVSFETRFTRYAYTKDGWVAITRTEPGEAEFVDGADRGHYPPPPP